MLHSIQIALHGIKLEIHDIHLYLECAIIYHIYDEGNINEDIYYIINERVLIAPSQHLQVPNQSPDT